MTIFFSPCPTNHHSTNTFRQGGGGRGGGRGGVDAHHHHHHHHHHRHNNSDMMILERDIMSLDQDQQHHQQHHQQRQPMHAQSWNQENRLCRRRRNRRRSRDEDTCTMEDGTTLEGSTGFHPTLWNQTAHQVEEDDKDNAEQQRRRKKCPRLEQFHIQRMEHRLEWASKCAKDGNGRMMEFYLEEAQKDAIHANAISSFLYWKTMILSTTATTSPSTTSSTSTTMMTSHI